MQNQIIEYSKELGFAKIGFCEPEVDVITYNNYLLYINNKYHSDMKWLENNLDKRKDLNLILNNIQTVIVLTYLYNTGEKHQFQENKISRYAWGFDYHDIILKKLCKIIEFMEQLNPNSNSKAYVDTGPILEKYFAEKSGVGWQGKNSLILNKEDGSYFFIGLILTTNQLAFTKKIANFCGNCKQCIINCPTNAIVSDKVIDSNKCISYWTIESKEKEFPSDIINNLNQWAFGCDICQEVCPWNRKAKLANEPLFKPQYGTNFELNDIYNLSEEQFKLRYKQSSIKRRKFSGIIRNLEYLNNKNLNKNF